MGVDILGEMNDLFNPQSTKIIETRTLTAHNDRISSFEIHHSFNRVEIVPRWLEKIEGRDNIHRQSRLWRTAELPGGKYFIEWLNRDWLPIEKLEERRHDLQIELLTFRRPPDTKEIVFYKKRDLPSSNLN